MISSILTGLCRAATQRIKKWRNAMRMTPRRAIYFAFALLALGWIVSYVAPKAAAQDAGWTTLFDGKTLDGWSQVGQSNWHVADGVLIADKMEGKEAGYLVSNKSYKNFIVRVEFWPSDDANSGIYFRCLDPKKITDRTCYEANIFDQRKDPSYGTGAITRYVEIDPMPKAGGKWNTYEVTANGRDVTVVLNGQTTAKLRNGMFDEGPIVLQHGAGAIKFRKVEVKPL
jgi:3-keto-disaccharide hydrolase